MIICLFKDFVAHKSFFKMSFFGILFFNKSFHLLLLYRATKFIAGLRIFRFLVTPIRYFSSVFTNCDVSPYAEIGTGLILQHPFSVIISGGTVIGSNVVIYHNVTIGKRYREKQKNHPPRIGDNVTIYCNSSIFGNVYIGANTIVGAHSLVLDSFPSDSIIFESPARLFQK